MKLGDKVAIVDPANLNCKFTLKIVAPKGTTWHDIWIPFFNKQIDLKVLKDHVLMIENKARD